MAEKIEMFAGWDWDGSVVVGRERNIHIDKECTVVIHDGEPERVFTESEVRAAAMAEPELPDEMPDEMWESCRANRNVMQEAMRVVVRLTRDGIIDRLIGESPSTNHPLP